MNDFHDEPEISDGKLFVMCLGVAFVFVIIPRILGAFAS